MAYEYVGCEDCVRALWMPGEANMGDLDPLTAVSKQGEQEVERWLADEQG